MIIKLEETAYFDFITSNPNTGAAQDADSTPSCEIFEDATDTTVYALAATVKRTSKTGDYRQQVDFTAANGFEAGKSYNLVASATVATVAAKAVIGFLRVRVRSNDDFAFPATSGRSMVVDAAGLVDANVVKLGPTGTGAAQTARDLGASVLLASPQGLKKNTAFSGFTFVMYDSSGVPKTGLSSFTKQEWIDGAAAASLSGTVSELASGVYKIDTLSAGELNGDGIMLRFAATGAADTFVWIKTVSP